MDLCTGFEKIKFDSSFVIYTGNWFSSGKWPCVTGWQLIDISNYLTAPKKWGTGLLHPWSWRHHDCSKRRKSLTQRHNFMSQTTWNPRKVATIATKIRILHFAGISFIFYLYIYIFYSSSKTSLWSWRGMTWWQWTISCETCRRKRPRSNLLQALLSWYFSWQTGNKLSGIKQPSNRDFGPENSSTIGRRVTDCVSLQSGMRRECEQMERIWITENKLEKKWRTVYIYIT